jgi:hypothetical protein
MNCKGHGKKQLCPTLRYYPTITLQELRKTMHLSGRTAEFCAEMNISMLYLWLYSGNPYLRFLWRAMDLNWKLGKILNRGHLTQIPTWYH